MKALLALLIFAAMPAGAQGLKKPQPHSSLDSHLDPGPKPQQNPDGSVPWVLDYFAKNLKDPTSLTCTDWKVTKGQTAGGQAAWDVSVSWNSKNSYGGYGGATTSVFVFRNGEFLTSRNLYGH